MADLLENSSTSSAKLVMEQLSDRSTLGKEAPDIWALRLRAYLKLGEFGNALHSALQLSKLGKRSRFISETKLIEHLALIYSTLGDHEKAYNEYALLMAQKQSLNIEYIYGAAFQALEMKQHETAITLFAKILRVDPNHLPSLCKIGRSYFEKRLYSEALGYLNRAYSRNYDSNELRYYLALTLMQVSGKDMTSFGLLQRVSEDPAWSKEVLPLLARLSAKLKNYSKVTEACDRYYALYGNESSKNVLDELTMLQANAYRYLGDFALACELWEKIDTSSSYYIEAEANLSFFLPFLTHDSIFGGYLNFSPSEFVNLCTDVCDFILKKDKPKAKLTLEARILKAVSVDNPEAHASAFLGAIIQQCMARWNPNTGKSERCPPDFHIFLRLDQGFRNIDLQLNLNEFYIEKEDFSRVIHINLYAFHDVWPTAFAHADRYELLVHEPAELHQILHDMGQSRLVETLPQ